MQFHPCFFAKRPFPQLESVTFRSQSVVLDTLNRARFSVAAESFIKTGSRFKDAFQDPVAYLAVEPFFQNERYLVTYNPSKCKVYALLKDQAKSDDVLKVAFHAYVLLHSINSSNDCLSLGLKPQEYDNSSFMATTADLEAYIGESCKMVSTAYGVFKSKVVEQSTCVNWLNGRTS